jgi:hypothetical protein
MLRHVALVRTDVSEELRAYQVLVFIRSVRRLLVTASVITISPIFVTLMKEALSSSETSVLTRATRRNISEDTILHSHRRENLKSYIFHYCHCYVRHVIQQGWSHVLYKCRVNQGLPQIMVVPKLVELTLGRFVLKNKMPSNRRRNLRSFVWTKSGKRTCLWNHELIGKDCERSLYYGLTVMPTCCLRMHVTVRKPRVSWTN